ncbi:hypothetical protein E2320_000905 [Naja naja]|nr:hypothetical protein E2320_000905 [Naja naja]
MEQSSLSQVPLRSFQSLQQDWKMETAGLFHDLCTKEKVTPPICHTLPRPGGAQLGPTSPGVSVWRDWQGEGPERHPVADGPPLCACDPGAEELLCIAEEHQTQEAELCR